MRRTRVDAGGFHAGRAAVAFSLAALSLLAHLPAAARDGPPSGAATGTGAADIVIGAVGSTSPQRPDGAAVVTGVARAADEINRQTGGLLGAHIAVVSDDDACSRDGAVAAAQRMVARSPAVVIGHVCDSSALAAAPIYAQAGILFIATGPRHPDLTERRAGPLVFRLASRADGFGPEVAEYVKRRFPGRRIALVHDRSVQATRLADQAAAALALLAAPEQPAIVLRESYVAGEKHYHALADRLKAAGTEVVILPAQPVEAAIIVRRLTEIGSPVSAIGSEILAVPEAAALAREMGDRFIVLVPPRSTPGPALGAEALRHWVSAVSAAGTTGSAEVARALTGGSQDRGEERESRAPFDAKGDSIGPAFVPHTWQRSEGGG